MITLKEIITLFNASIYFNSCIYEYIYLPNPEYIYSKVPEFLTPEAGLSCSSCIKLSYIILYDIFK